MSLLGSLTSSGCTCHILSHLWSRTILAGLIYWLGHIVGKIEVVTIAGWIISLAIIVINSTLSRISVVLSILEAVRVATTSLTSRMTMLWRSLLTVWTLILKYTIDPLNEIGGFRYRRSSTGLLRLLRTISVRDCFELLPRLLRTVHGIHIPLVIVLIVC